jgi:hypothetical protein
MLPRLPRRAVQVLQASALALAVALAPGPARADRLTDDELARLHAGEVVTRHVDADLGGSHYIGGLAYALVDAPPEAVMAALLDPASYVSILPLTLEAREVARADGDRFVFFRHGTSVVSGAYTCRIRAESQALVRFWMDPSAPHDFEDMWGYFRVEPAGAGKTLLTYAAVMDLGFGFLSLFFEEKVRGYALRAPALIRRFVESRSGARVPGAARTARESPR